MSTITVIEQKRFNFDELAIALCGACASTDFIFKIVKRYEKQNDFMTMLYIYCNGRTLDALNLWIADNTAKILTELSVY